MVGNSYHNELAIIGTSYLCASSISRYRQLLSTPSRESQLSTRRNSVQVSTTTFDMSKRKLDSERLWNDTKRRSREGLGYEPRPTQNQDQLKNVKDRLDQLPDYPKYIISRMLTNIDHVRFCILKNVSLCARNISRFAFYKCADLIISHCSGNGPVNLEFVKQYANEHLKAENWYSAEPSEFLGKFFLTTYSRDFYISLLLLVLKFHFLLFSGSTSPL